MVLIVGRTTSTIMPMTFPRTDLAEIAAGLVDLLDLREVAPSGDFSTPATVAAYQGDSSPHPGGHVFGGQVMGQAVTAVGRTVSADRRIHSMYSDLLAPGDPAHPIRFQVDALRDGGSFSVRRVLTQPGRGRRGGAHHPRDDRLLPGEPGRS